MSDQRRVDDQGGMLLTGVFERFPRLRMAITEAGSFWAADMLALKTVLAERDHAGIPELVTDDVTGYLVAERDVAAYTQSM